MQEHEVIQSDADSKPTEETPEILEEIAIEELAIDGICGVY